MSKTTKKHHREEENDDGVDPRFLHVEKQQKIYDRRVEQALKTKDISKFIPQEEEDEDLDLYGKYDDETNEEYCSCKGCGIVLFSEEDLKSSKKVGNDIFCKKCGENSV